MPKMKNWSLHETFEEQPAWINEKSNEIVYIEKMETPESKRKEELMDDYEDHEKSYLYSVQVKDIGGYPEEIRDFKTKNKAKEFARSYLKKNPQGIPP